jgi:aspartyl/glutamyl-tRNA(Asn/Gln) amidotransferase C subunit
LIVEIDKLTKSLSGYRFSDMSSTSSNSITLQDVKKVANLSRLSTDLSDEISTKFQKNLNNILGYANKLSNVDTTGYSPHSTIATVGINDLRDDSTDHDTPDYQRIRQNILNNFPVRQGDFLQLPVRIVEDK